MGECAFVIQTFLIIFSIIKIVSKKIHFVKILQKNNYRFINIDYQKRLNFFSQKNKIISNSMHLKIDQQSLDVLFIHGKNYWWRRLFHCMPTRSTGYGTLGTFPLYYLARN